MTLIGGLSSLTQQCLDACALEVSHVLEDGPARALPCLCRLCVRLAACALSSAIAQPGSVWMYVLLGCMTDN